MATPRSPLRSLVSTASRFWRGPTALKAFLLTATAFAFAFADVAVQLLINRWNRTFYDALERKAAPELYSAAYEFAVLAIAATVVVMAATLCKLLLQIEWRRFVTERAVARWLDQQAFYRLTVVRGSDFNPEHRIAEDVRLTVEPVVDLTIGFVSAVTTVVSFIGVLWVVGGATTIAGVTIPGHMALLAIVYAVGVTALMTVFGHGYSQRIRDRSEAEARYRYELSRLRENAESVALVGGERGERRLLLGYFDNVARRWRSYALCWTRMTWVTYTNALVAPILPLLVMTPKYLSGEITLGAMMQTATAFGVVQGALGWFTSNYARLSEWHASASRVAELFDVLDQSNGPDAATSRIEIVRGFDEALKLEGLSVELHDGDVLITDADAVISPGDMVMISGQSGSGKSTLVRAIAGLWPWGRGRIVLPADPSIAFLPQRSYLPNGTLRGAIAYPKPPASLSDEVATAALTSTGLEHLIPSLDLDRPWDKYLSGGEQQRVGFARLLVHKPRLVILDEATSALDEVNEARMMELFTHELFFATVISVAHRPSLVKYHNRVLTVHRSPKGSSVMERNGEDTFRHRIRAALTAIGALGRR